jgi:hypothetical protein
MPARTSIAHDKAVVTVGSLDAEYEPPFEQWLREAASTVGGAVTQHEALGIQIRKYYEVSTDTTGRTVPMYLSLTPSPFFPHHPCRLLVHPSLSNWPAKLS